MHSAIADLHLDRLDLFHAGEQATPLPKASGQSPWDAFWRICLREGVGEPVAQTDEGRLLVWLEV